MWDKADPVDGVEKEGKNPVLLINNQLWTIPYPRSYIPYWVNTFLFLKALFGSDLLVEAENILTDTNVGTQSSERFMGKLNIPGVQKYEREEI